MSGVICRVAGHRFWRKEQVAEWETYARVDVPDCTRCDHPRPTNPDEQESGR